MDDRYISIKQAMEMLGIKSRTSFDKLCRVWKIEKYKVNGYMVRVRLSQIKDRMEHSRTAS